MTTNAIECEKENGTKPFRITFHTLLAPYSTFRMQNKSMEKKPVELKCTQTRAIQYQIFKFIRVAKIATALQWQRIEAIYKLNVLKRARREVHERKRERETGAHHLKVYNITSGAFSNHIIFGYRVFM